MLSVTSEVCDFHVIRTIYIRTGPSVTNVMQNPASSWSELVAKFLGTTYDPVKAQFSTQHMNDVMV